MATIYIDPSAGVNGTGTFASPFNTWASVTFAAGNTYLQKGGTTQTGYRVLVTAGGTDESSRVILGSYDPATGARTTNGEKRAILNGAGTAQTLRVSQNISFVTVDNFEVYGTDGTGGTRAVAVYIGNVATNPCSDIILSNLLVHDVNPALFPTQDNNAIQGFVNRCTITRCEIYNIPTDGIWMQGNHINITHNVIRNISTQDIRGDCIQTSGDATLRNDYGYVANNYLDHSNRNSKQVIIVGGIGYCDGAVIEDNYCVMAAYDDIATTCIFSESSNAKIRRNKCYGGYFGIFCNTNADNNIVESNLLVNNERGLSCSSPLDNVVFRGNTVVGSKIHGIYVDSTGSGCAVQNNLTYGCAIGVMLRSNIARDYNAYFGNVTDFVAGTGGGSIDIHRVTADPMVSVNYAPLAGSPLLRAGVHIAYTRDIRKRQRPNPPSIGAYDCAPMLLK